MNILQKDFKNFYFVLLGEIVENMDRLNKHFDSIVCYDNLFKDHFINIMQIPKLEKLVLNTGIGKDVIVRRSRIFPALFGLELVSNQRPNVTRAKKSVDKFKLRKNMPVGCKVSLRKLNANSFLDRLLNFALPSYLLEKESLISKKKRQRKSLRKWPIQATPGSEKMSFANSNRVLFLQKILDEKTENSFRVHVRGFSPCPKSYEKENPHLTSKMAFSFGIDKLTVFREIRYDKFDVFFGANVTCVISQAKASQLSKPQYFLSAFQMPLY